MRIIVYIDKLQIINVLYSTTKTIPGGGKYHDCPLAFKVLFWSKNYIYSLCHINNFLGFQPEKYLNKNLNKTITRE